MSVSNTNIIDLISISQETGRVILTLTDHLAWGNNEHLWQLQEKLNAYLRFIESGELLTSYPKAKGREPLIDVVCKYTPDEAGYAFLAKTSAIIERAGIKFRHRIFVPD